MKKQNLPKRKSAVSFSPQPPRVVRWGCLAYDSIPLIAGFTDKGVVCRLAFARGKMPRSAPAAWKKEWPQTEFIRDPESAAELAKKIRAGARVDLLVVGTEFQRAIWRGLLAIPCGEVVTYAELARRIRRPKAVRAAGSACGANPVAILVPCHRVIASDGSLGGFGGGLPVKRKLLRKEAAGR